MLTASLSALWHLSGSCLTFKEREHLNSARIFQNFPHEFTAAFNKGVKEEGRRKLAIDDVANAFEIFNKDPQKEEFFNFHPVKIRA